MVAAMCSAASPQPWEASNRLPESTQPLHYDLHLHPDLSSKLFSGRVSIEINSTEVRDFFVVHSKGLDISDTQLEQCTQAGAWQTVPLLDSFAYAPNEFWVVRTRAPVSVGLYRLTCVFTGSLVANGLVGFYYSTYVDECNSTRVLATTKFEPTYARQAFPCFDEPSFKSTFSIAVVRPNDDYIVLCNMPVRSEAADEPSTGLTVVTFEKSVPMVTYLVCFIVCDFAYIEQVLPSGLPFRVYAPRARVSNTRYALGVGVQVLQYYERMFDLPFPLPKSDMAAIPDYVSGATEHWGLITFRETSIFYDPLQSSATNRERVCSVVAHELAHQWFGNLVTLKWWDDLWLNEGFATYMQYKGVDHMHPDWAMDDQFCVRTLQTVLTVDSMLSSHPIVKSVTTPDQITGMFDTISYNKGASVLRMLEGFVGSSVFQRGVSSFLRQHAYHNAVTAQLWAALTEAWAAAGVQRDVGAIMGTWTEQTGYPVLTVTRTADTVTVTQQRFLHHPTEVAEGSPSTSPHGYRWHVPISFVTSQDPATPQTAWLGKDDPNTTISLDSGVDWIKLNYKQQGYYRVKYDTATWRKMAELCGSEQLLGPADRASLYDDALALADASLLPYSTALSLSTCLKGEQHLVPWAVAARRLPALISLLTETAAKETFKNFVAELAEERYLALGWHDEGDHLQQLLRVEVVSLACSAGLGPALQEAAALLQSYVQDDGYALPLGTKRQVLRHGMVLGGSGAVWDKLWQRSTMTQDATLKDNLLFGLSNSQDTATLTRFIAQCQDSSVVRTQDFLVVLTYVSGNLAGKQLVWDWVRSNWQWLVARYSLNDRILGNLIPLISKFFTTQEKLDEMEAFFALYPECGAGERGRRQALETVKGNIRWVNDNFKQISDWLAARNTA